jgi:putative DNA primase/helicase
VSTPLDLDQLAAAAVRRAPTEPRGPRGPRRERGTDGPLGTLAVRKVSEITPTVVRWFWDARIAYGKLNVLGGPPGVGKSYLTCALATAASRGRELPGDPRLDARPERVVLLSYEDDPEDTIRPRLDLLGADLDRIEVVEGVDADGRRGSFGPEAVPILAAHIGAGPPVGLVVVDPVSAFIGAGTDEYRGNEVRAALEELRLLAQRHRVAVLLLMHTRKAQADTALNRLSGSSAYGQLIRSGLMAGPIPDDPNGWHALAHVKHNLSAKQPTLAYSVGEDGLAWHGEVDLDGEEVAGNADGGDRSAGEEAAEFLLEVLADGPVTAKQVLAEARQAGIAERTLKRAKSRLRVASIKQADRWTWELPPAPPPAAVERVEDGEAA